MSKFHAGQNHPFMLYLVTVLYLDRYLLSNYGVSMSPEWVRDFIVGLVVWVGLGVRWAAKLPSCRHRFPTDQFSGGWYSHLSHCAPCSCSAGRLFPRDPRTLPRNCGVEA